MSKKVVAQEQIDKVEKLLDSVKELNIQTGEPIAAVSVLRGQGSGHHGNWRIAPHSWFKLNARPAQLHVHTPLSSNDPWTRQARLAGGGSPFPLPVRRFFLLLHPFLFSSPVLSLSLPLPLSASQTHTKPVHHGCR